ncbi:hypothetical protein DL95DRAFT_394393 [Leptodontidium sp. 2 PMI_412]|nr:putative high mobility group protein 1 [Leptodontidium sp. MPI-SDFR-AT-0119]KAH9209447.1 hypothetical protein DL95DRAFT_394393 [Leptodontidium sp. 2 PMI_412]
MARAKKPEEKPKEGATLTIDVDSFVRTRDSVVTGLATLQDAIQTLSSAYIKHTNAVLGEHGAGIDVDSALAKLGQNPLLSLGDLNRAVSPAKSVVADVPDKKERKKRQHDPNAPKRPLTPFFLYMQTARPIIAEDLGSDFGKGAVSTEGTRRWGTMAAEDKQLWTNAYKDNLRLYNARMHSYKSGGNQQAKDMSDQEAAIYADLHNIGADNTADAQLVGESSAAALHDEDAEGEPDKEPTPPPKTPKTKGGRKTKASKNNTPAAPPTPETIIPPASASSIVPPKTAEKDKSPDKKRKRTSKKDEAAAAAAEKEDLAVETPKSAPKPRKKKAKADS